MSTSQSLKAIWGLPGIQDKTPAQIRAAIWDSAFYDAFFNRNALWYQAKLNNRGQSGELQISRYDPLNMFYGHPIQSARRKNLTALMTMCLSPVTAATFILSLGSEATRFVYANEKEPISWFMHYCVMAPLRTIWAWTVEPLGKLTIYARDGFFYHAKNGHKLKAIMYGLALIASTALSWISLFAAFGIGVGVAITKGLSSVNALKAIGHVWQKTIGAFCRSVMRLCGGVSSGLMGGVSATAPFVAGAAVVSHPIELTRVHRTKRKSGVQDFDPNSLEDWADKTQSQGGCIPKRRRRRHRHKPQHKKEQTFHFDQTGAVVTGNPAAGVEIVPT